MKSNCLYSICILMFALFSCKKTPSKITQNSMVISGKITNSKSNLLLLNNSFYNTLDTLLLNEDGTFLDTLQVNEGIYNLVNNTQSWPLYLYKGATINMRVNLDSVVSSLNYTQDKSHINQYISDKLKNTHLFYKTHKKLYLFGAKEFKEIIKNSMITKDRFLKQYKNLPNTFKALEKRNLKYEYLNALLSFSEYNTDVPDDFLNELDTFPFTKINTDDYFYSKDYHPVLNYLITSKSEEQLKNNPNDFLLIYLKMVAEKSKNEAVRSAIAYKLVINENSLLQTSKPNEYYHTLLELSKNQSHIDTFTTIYTNVLKIQKGQIAPKFENYKNSKGGTTSLNDLKGSYVYIDVWATWCAPCLTEVPYLKKIIKKYQGKNIEFIGISIDEPKNYTLWKKMIETKKMLGYQLFSNDAWRSQFMQEFMVSSIPRFIFLDPEGKIIDYNAPRPSNPKLETLFNAYNL